jgi:proteasome accessory factor C
MSKSISAPLARTARVLDLVPYINTHQGIALKELAQHFEVTPAQMNADLMTLWMCGLPGYTHLELMNLDFESGFVSIGNASTLSKPRAITFQECVALLLGLDLIASLLPIDRQDLLTAAESLRKRLTDILGLPIKLSVVGSTSGAVATAITQAIETNSGLKLRYHSLYKDQVTERIVVPVNLYESDNHQYMRAFCSTAKDYREFRVDRIDQATPADFSAEFPAKADGTEKLSFSIKILASSRDVTERFAISQSTIGSSIELSSYSRQWIERSVMASGEAVCLNSPLDIRAEMARKAQLILDRYKAE